MTDKHIDIRVKVQPRSSQRSIGVVENGRIRIRTTAAPADGKANQDVARQLADAFGVAPTRITLLKGTTSRLKTFRVDSPRLLPDWARHPDFS
ncbi:MAG: DUF167 domain-containing protein [Woeseiaceae bacterium]